MHEYAFPEVKNPDKTKSRNRNGGGLRSWWRRAERCCLAAFCLFSGCRPAPFALPQRPARVAVRPLSRPGKARSTPSNGPSRAGIFRGGTWRVVQCACCQRVGRVRRFSFPRRRPLLGRRTSRSREVVLNIHSFCFCIIMRDGIKINVCFAALYFVFRPACTIFATDRLRLSFWAHAVLTPAESVNL